MLKDKSMPYNDWESVLDDAGIKRVSLAIKALETGTASQEQQIFILGFIIRVGCRTYDTDWFTDERTSCFAAGRRYVGQQIVRFLNLKLGKLKTGE